MGEGAGRPSKLNDDFIAKADEYMDVWNGEELKQLIPSVAGLSVFTRVNRDSIYAWVKAKPASVPDSVYTQFSDILGLLVSTQELTLLNGGLGGTLNSTITKLVLHKHNYTEKTEVDNTSSDGSMATKELKVTVVRPKKAE
jgi:hypothetical protein